MTNDIHPTALRDIGEGLLEIAWEDETVSRYRYRDLRAECPCAQCVDEWTGRRILQVDRVDASVHPLSVAMIGNYAVKFNWSDGHSTGIYTFTRLRELGSKVA